MRYVTSLELYERRKERNETANIFLNKLKGMLPKDQYDTIIQPLLQELNNKSAINELK